MGSYISSSNKNINDNVFVKDIFKLKKICSIQYINNFTRTKETKLKKYLKSSDINDKIESVINNFNDIKFKILKSEINYNKEKNELTIITELEIEKINNVNIINKILFEKELNTLFHEIDFNFDKTAVEINIENIELEKNSM